MRLPTFLSRVLLLTASFAVPGAAAAADPACIAAASAAERAEGLPPGLLGAIGAVESANRRWAIDADGRPLAAADLADATLRSAGAIAEGARFVDVGCFQVDLRYHGAAFGSLADAFDPMRNAIVAARFLASLHRAAGDWTRAIGRYHTRGVGGLDYASRVLAAWQGGPPRTLALASAPLRAPEIRFGMRIITPGAPLDASIVQGP